MNDAQDEIARLREEVAELRKALGEKQQLSTPNLPALRDNFEFIADCARFAEGLLPEATVRKKYGYSEDTWTKLGSDEQLVARIEEEKTRRIRDGSFKRERSQELITKAPDVLGKILLDEKASPKHRIDASKTLDAFAANGPEAAPEQDRFIIRIDLTAGGGEVVEFNKAVRPNDPSDLDPVNGPLPGFMITARKDGNDGGQPL